MSKFEILSVAEDNHKANCLSAKQMSYKGGITQSLYISINTDRELTINLNPDTDYRTVSRVFKGVDVDSLIEYLQDVKTFLSEEDMIATLMGRK